MRNRNRERGAETLEFTMIGLPLTFLLYSIANMCFSMLTLHTLQEAVEQGARYTATRGATCSSGTNSCSATVQQIAGVVATQAAGVILSKLNISLIPAGDTANTITCSPITTCLSSCASGCNSNRTTVWPTATNSDNSPGQDIIITGDCPVVAPMSMFWTGSSPSSAIASSHFYAYSRQRLTF
jgi:Flp pilus assembly protein TadG